MAFSGAAVPRQAHGRALVLVQDYIIRKNLKEIGYVLDPYDLSDFEGKYLMTCQANFAQLETEQRDKKQ